MPIIPSAAHGDGDSRFQGWIMGIRALCAAAAVVVGAGSAADAATYRYELTYQNSLFSDAEVWRIEPEELLFAGNLNSTDDLWGIPTALPGIVPGTKVMFELIFDAGKVVRCMIGSFDCHPGKTVYARWGESPIFTEHEFMEMRFSGEAQIGTLVELYDIRNAAGHVFSTPDYYISVWSRYSYFTVSDLTPGIAPVPLPATAALLPLGIGALAILRRRRRSGQGLT